MWLTVEDYSKWKGLLREKQSVFSWGVPHANGTYNVWGGVWVENRGNFAGAKRHILASFRSTLCFGKMVVAHVTRGDGVVYLEYTIPPSHPVSLPPADCRLSLLPHSTAPFGFCNVYWRVRQSPSSNDVFSFSPFFTLPILFLSFVFHPHPYYIFSPHLFPSVTFFPTFFSQWQPLCEKQEKYNIRLLPYPGAAAAMCTHTFWIWFSLCAQKKVWLGRER